VFHRLSSDDLVHHTAVVKSLSITEKGLAQSATFRRKSIPPEW
jgi:hypothetical protein